MASNRPQGLGNLQTQNSPGDASRRRTGPTGQSDQGNGQGPGQHEEDRFDSAVVGPEHQQQDGQGQCGAPDRNGAGPRHLDADLGRSHQQKDSDPVGEQQRPRQDHQRKKGMQAPQAGQHRLAVRVAELVFGDDGDEQVAQDQAEREAPHEGVTVVASRHGRLDDVPGSQPGQDHDDPGSHGPDVFRKGTGNGRRLAGAAVFSSHFSPLLSFLMRRVIPATAGPVFPSPPAGLPALPVP